MTIQPPRESNLMHRSIQGAMLGTVIALSAGYASTPTSESTEQYVDNSVLTAKVKAALVEEKIGDLISIEVESYESVVQLSGFVDSEMKKIKAPQINRLISVAHQSSLCANQGPGR